MDSNLLSYIGLGNIDPAYIYIGFIVLIFILFVILIVQMVNMSKLKKKYETFMQGRNAISMEDEITKLFSDMDFLKISSEKNSRDIKKIYENLKVVYQKVGVVRYDAFQQMGGQLSFSIALLNGNDNGFIINSVHSSDGCYTYTKEVKNGESSISLGEEEKQALENAMKSTFQFIPEKIEISKNEREVKTEKKKEEKKKIEKKRYIRKKEEKTQVSVIPDKFKENIVELSNELEEIE